jgi:hypothetical protein
MRLFSGTLEKLNYRVETAPSPKAGRSPSPHPVFGLAPNVKSRCPPAGKSSSLTSCANEWINVINGFFGEEGFQTAAKPSRNRGNISRDEFFSVWNQAKSIRWLNEFPACLMGFHY